LSLNEDDNDELVLTTASEDGAVDELDGVLVESELFVVPTAKDRGVDTAMGAAVVTGTVRADVEEFVGSFRFTSTVLSCFEKPLELFKKADERSLIFDDFTFLEGSGSDLPESLSMTGVPLGVFKRAAIFSTLDATTPVPKVLDTALEGAGFPFVAAGEVMVLGET
jgi:hypothetical protein